MAEITEQQESSELVSNVAMRGEAWWHDTENSLRMAVDSLPIPLSVKTWFGDVAVQAWTEGAITAVQEYGDEMKEVDAAFDKLWDRDMKAVSAWRAAHPGNDLKVRLAEYYTPEEADLWLCSPHPQLEGQRPVDLMARGEHEKVNEILDRLDSCGYL